MSENKHEIVDEKSPFRCQGIVNSGSRAGQCRYKCVEGTKYCPQHGGARDAATNERYKLAKYRLQQYDERVSDFAKDDEIKSLREEIGIVRMILEALINSFKGDNNKMLLSIDKVTQLVGQINKLIVSAQMMEEKTNTLLDRKVVVIIADSMVQIIAQYITDPDVLTTVAGKICASIESAASVTANVGTVSQGNN